MTAASAPMLVSPDGRKYAVTSNDKLWLLRAVAAEGAPENYVAQTLVNGFIWARDAVRYPGTLADWVRIYAQPVNPAWFVSGAKHRERMSQLTDDKARARELSAAHAREYAHSVRNVFSAKVHDAVEQALRLPPAFPDATDYAAAWHDASKRGYQARTPAVAGTNRLWARGPAVGFQGYTVLAAGPAVGLVLLLVGLAVLGARYV